MKQTTPKISVLMSVYNGSPYLQESVESILNQTFSDFEFIIIDDCSIDNSRKIIEEYAKKDRRITLIVNEENLGLTKSLNKGLKVAKGEYIARQDADDISLPKRLEKEVFVLAKHSDVVLVSCEMEEIDAEGNITGISRRACDSNLVAWHLLFHNHLGGHSQVMFRREPTINLGGYCEDYRYAQDYELWGRLLKLGKIVILPDVLLKQRSHNKSISNSKKSEQETYVVFQVQHGIQQLTCKEISLEEAKNLMYFWSASPYWCQFPNSKDVDKINARINEIYHIFIQQARTKNLPAFQLSKKLKSIIGQRFLVWIQNCISDEHNLLATIKISSYALIWCPMKVPSAWLIGIWNSKSYLKSKLIRIAVLLTQIIIKKCQDNNSV